MAVPDDPDLIPGPSVLYRAVHERYLDQRPDGTTKVMSPAFEASSDGSGTSVVVAHLMGARGDGQARTAADLRPQFPKSEIWQLTAEDARSAAEGKGTRLGVLHAPLDDEPGHANITWPSSDELSRSGAHRVRRILADRARRAHDPAEPRPG